MRQERIKLHLGCGHVYIPGFTNVDIRSDVQRDMTYDLNRTPWPWEDGCCIEMICNHVIEHLDIGLHGFLDEAHRLLLPGGTLYVEVPDAANIDLAFSDPTHKWAFRPHSFINYVTPIGVKTHGVIKYPWSLMHCTSDGSVIRAHLLPLSDEEAFTYVQQSFDYRSG